jgi:signal transduction histidine kinase
MKVLNKNYTLFTIIFLIALLLLANIYLINRNNAIIRENKALQDEAEQIKVNTKEIIRNVHFLDMTVRGYALTKVVDGQKDINGCFEFRDQTFAKLEPVLKKQNFPMAEFFGMQDSIIYYFSVVDQLRHYVEEEKRPQFLALLNQNKGYYAWKVYDKFSRHVHSFENTIVQQAQIRYETTLRNSYFLQIFLFLIIVPTLFYTAFYTFKSMKLTEQLRQSEAGRNLMLEDQKQILENKVLERTNEIQFKNKEILSHNERLTAQQNQIASQHSTLLVQNFKLQEAKRTIEEQSQVIQAKNTELTKEVNRQTQDLQQTNLELVEYNNRLEQFTYIISHNLRAPITRLVGLANILNYSKDDTEKETIVNLMIKSTHDLDDCITDLNQILGIQKLSTQVYSKIKLDDLVIKVRYILEEELKETKCQLITDFQGAEDITSLPQYMESIFYNLISNAIKYRNPERTPVINIRSKYQDGKMRIDVVDNGLGIDMEKNRNNLFNLYKRFHFHVEGKGLGLYLVKTQVTALGGTIDVTSKPYEGTMFTILLNN